LIETNLKKLQTIQSRKKLWRTNLIRAAKQTGVQRRGKKPFW
jgi:hypothetical protein